MAITKNMVSDNKHVVNQIVTLSKELLFVLFLLALVLVLKPIKADAATINVVAGSSAVNADGNCQLEEAVGNINDGNRTNTDCVETGTYGTDDTINLPAGTITGPGSTVGNFGGKSFKIIGQGRNTSVIEDGGFYLSGSGLGTALFKDLKMVGSAASININSYDTAEINNVEIDLDSAGYTAISAEGDLIIRDSYLHNGITGSGSAALVDYFGIDDNITTHLNISNTTFSDSSGGLGITGSGLIDTTIKNSTFSDLHGGENSSAYGIKATVYNYNFANSAINYTTTNNTFKNITGPLDGSGNPTAMAIAETVYSGGKINHTAQNDVYAVGNGTAVNYFRQLDGSTLDESDITTTSLGGNLSSDNSFGSRLNHATDQNNVTTLASFLGVLSDNGGKVPTLALQEGSPAINAGTNVAGMTTDARGAVRPQGGAFDSGAYESAFSSESNNNGGESGGGNSNSSSSANLTSPTSSVSQFSNKPITITTPTGTTITSSNTVTESSLGTQDTNNQYPLGLVNFTFNTSQTDNLVTLTFITDLKPNQVKPRKYNPDTKAYTDITNYTLTETTINGQHALVLTYTITDNGDLDTNKTTGVISDPVGLAMTNSSYDQLANTGQESLIAGLIAGLTMITGSIVLLTTRLKDKVKYSFKR